MTVLPIVLMLVGIALFSVSVLAAEPVAVEVPAASATVQLAAIANEEAVREAALSIQTLNKLDLDIRLVGPTSVQIANK